MVRKYRNRISQFILVVFLGATIWLLPAMALAQSQFTSGLEYDTKGKPTAVVVNFRNNEIYEMYIGISIYPAGITDVLLQGVHLNETVQPGQSFIKKYFLKDANNNDITGGTYETALWGKKIPRKEATDPNNFFCKKWGFCFVQQKSYTTGWIMPISSTK